MSAIMLLLVRGLPERNQEHWLLGLKRMTEHATPLGFPKYGYLLDCDGGPVGVLLVIFPSMIIDGVTSIRGNVAS
jgi:hypothetical protein